MTVARHGFPIWRTKLVHIQQRWCGLGKASCASRDVQPIALMSLKPGMFVVSHN